MHTESLCLPTTSQQHKKAQYSYFHGICQVIITVVETLSYRVHLRLSVHQDNGKEKKKRDTGLPICIFENFFPSKQLFLSSI